MRPTILLSIALILVADIDCLHAKEPTKPIVIAHRGASGYRPEHTLEAYKLAIEQGADFIEPDLVATKDGHLICRHDVLLDDTTNVAELPQFADRNTTKTVDGKQVTGWFACDFTLAEIRQIGARTRVAHIFGQNFGLITYDRPVLERFNDKFKIATFDEVCQLAKQHQVGIYPELKQPAFHSESAGADMVALLMKSLQSHDLLGESNVKVFVQCFESEPLVELRKRIGSESPVRLIQLVGSLPRDGASTLEQDAKYADGIGPSKSDVVRYNGDGTLMEGTQTETETGLARRARCLNLEVHVWTLRADHPEPDIRQVEDGVAVAEMRAEIRRLLDAGVDGIFADHPDVARRAVDAWWAERQAKLKPLQATTQQ